MALAKDAGLFCKYFLEVNKLGQTVFLGQIGFTLNQWQCIGNKLFI